MPKTKLPVESYDPRLLVLLEKGSRTEVKLPCGTRENAIHTRHQIHSFRHALKTNKRTDWEQLYAAGVYIDPADPTTVIVRPRSFWIEQNPERRGNPSACGRRAAPSPGHRWSDFGFHRPVPQGST